MKHRRPHQHPRSGYHRRDGTYVSPTTVNRGIHYKQVIRSAPRRIIQPIIQNNFRQHYQNLQNSYLPKEESKETKLLRTLEDNTHSISQNITRASDIFSLINGDIFTNLLDKGVSFVATAIIKKLDENNFFENIENDLQIDYLSRGILKSSIRTIIETVLEYAIKKLKSYFTKIELQEEINNGIKEIIVDEIITYLRKIPKEGVRRIYSSSVNHKFYYPEANYQPDYKSVVLFNFKSWIESSRLNEEREIKSIEKLIKLKSNDRIHLISTKLTDPIMETLKGKSYKKYQYAKRLNDSANQTINFSDKFDMSFFVLNKIRTFITCDEIYVQRQSLEFKRKDIQLILLKNVKLD